VDLPEESLHLLGLGLIGASRPLGQAIQPLVDLSLDAYQLVGSLRERRRSRVDPDPFVGDTPA